MVMKRIVVLASVVAAFLGLAWRLYAPGAFDERLHRAALRWRPFTALTTWKFLGQGLRATLALAVLSVVLSLAFGLVLGVVRLSGHPRLRSPLRFVRPPVTLMVNAVRSLPLFMLILYAYLALPRLGIRLTPFWAGVSALTLYTSSVLSELVRGGVLALPRGQLEAAEAMGLSLVARLRFVVLPQALRAMVPAIVSQLATLIKDTSLVSFITVIELTRRGQILSQFANNPIETFIVVLAMYFAINMALSVFASRLEERRELVVPAEVR